MKLDEIRKLIDAATPGPWVVYQEKVGDLRHVQAKFDPENDDSFPALDCYPHDAAFIAASRTLLPRLLAVAQMVEEFANGKLDYGDITAPVARAAMLEHMFFVMRQKAREALAALEAET